jgi:hypothetical protein
LIPQKGERPRDVGGSMRFRGRRGGRASWSSGPRLKSIGARPRAGPLWHGAEGTPGAMRGTGIRVDGGSRLDGVRGVDQFTCLSTSSGSPPLPSDADEPGQTWREAGSRRMRGIRPLSAAPRRHCIKSGGKRAASPKPAG